MSRLADRDLSLGAKNKREVPKSAFYFLFSEMLHYHFTHCKNVSEFSDKLIQMGEHLGPKLLELLKYRLGLSQKTNLLGGEKNLRMEVTILHYLSFIRNEVFPYMGEDKNKFKLERHKTIEEQYHIRSEAPAIGTYISVPPDYQNSFSIYCFYAGVIKGILNCFFPGVDVNAYDNEEPPEGTTFVILFPRSAIDREILLEEN